MAALVLLKTVKNAKLYQDPTSKLKTILIENVRASFPFVGTPGKDEDDNGNEKESYRVVGMLPKETHEEAKKMCVDLIKELMTANDVKVPSTEWFITDGDGEKYQEDKNKMMNGHWLVSAKDAKVHPRVYDERGRPMDLTDEGLKKIDDKFYGGCWITMLIRPWYFNGTAKGSSKKYPKRVLAGLSSVQFHHDDTPFGQGRIDDTGIFGAVEGAEGGSNGMDDDDDL